MYKAVMMVTPSHFNVEYIINPYMKDTAGRPNKVNRTAAQKQWEGVKAKFESLGVKVHVIEGQPGLPDMVFSANHGFPFINSKTGKPSILMSQMKNPERRGEIPFVEKWFAQNGYVVEHLSNPKWFFEGNGDAIMHPNQKIVFAGHGHRTDVAV